MKRLKLLQEPEDSSSAMLETDIMRFVAIIGMVFWIIFSLVQRKTVDISEQETAMSIADKHEKEMVWQKQELIEVPPVPVVSNTTLPPIPEQDQVRAIKEIHSINADNQLKINSEAAVAISPQGVLLQFADLKDFKQLLSDGTIRLFGWAGGEGFELFFVAEQKAEGMVFHKCNHLPEQLWEITNAHYAVFIEEMARQNPAIHDLPRKRVLISFENQQLESEIEQRLSRMTSQGINGILSISADGRLHLSTAHSTRLMNLQ